TISNIPDMLLRLTGESMTDGTDEVTVASDPIVNWKNSINPGTYDAIQSDSGKRPVLEYGSDGAKEVRFDGTDDFLDLGNPAGLDFQRDEAKTIVILTGDNPANGGLLHKG